MPAIDDIAVKSFSFPRFDPVVDGDDESNTLGFVLGFLAHSRHVSCHTAESRPLI